MSRESEGILRSYSRDFHKIRVYCLAGFQPLAR